MVPGLELVGPGSGGVDVLERDVAVLVDCSKNGVVGVLDDDGDGATTPAPVLIELSTGGADVLERDVVVDGFVDDGGLEVRGVFGGVVDDEMPNPPATPGPPPTQT